MNLPVLNTQGQAVGEIAVQDEVFGVEPHPAAVHQAMVRQLANARQGNAQTKTRGEMAGSGRKLYAQKHTGRARAGMRRTPLRRGGGKAFGPKPRSYRQDMPKKMRRLALLSALSDKVRQGEMVVVVELKLDAPKVREMAGILKALKAAPPTLVVTDAPQPPVVLSARNLKGVKTLPAPLLNVLDLLHHRVMVITVPGVRRVEEIWGKKEAPGVGAS